MLTSGRDEPDWDRVLDYLGHDLEPSILIGGWATRFRVGGDISKDIDLIANAPGMRERLKQRLSDYSENTHHSGAVKVRGIVDGIHVDAYLVFESILGERLQLSVTRLANFVEQENRSRLVFAHS